MEWQPRAAAPKDGTWFLAYVPGSVMCWGDYEFSAWVSDYSGRWYFCETDTSEELDFSHWMPLPAPPKAALEQEQAEDLP
mgnify:FL=1